MLCSVLCKMVSSFCGTSELWHQLDKIYAWRVHAGGGEYGCFPFCQRFRKFRSEFKWKGSFRFLLTGIFRVTSGGGPHISVGIFQTKFAVPFLTNRFFALIREFGKRIEKVKSHFYWLARFNLKMSFHFPQVFPLISDRSVWHNGKHPMFSDRWI